MTALLDQGERDRFIEELGKNVSVIAPAGVGKTTSIVQRIVRIAQLPEAEAVDRLSRLVVVTYSVRAAQQMQQKARVEIRAAKLSSKVQRAFQQVFFGTIHSYCVRLLDRYGHYLGLPSPVGLLEDDAELWNRFLLRGTGTETANDANLRDLFHFYPPHKLYALGKEISPGEQVEVSPIPELDLQRLLDYNDPALHHATKRSIVHAQKAVQFWREAWARGERYRPLPKCLESDKAAVFAEIWRETFLPLHEWLRQAALTFGRRVANAYEAFRLSEAVMTYDDQVRLALRVLKLPAVQSELAAERISVLLDEAQDTDPRQFEVLRLVAGLGEGAEQAADQNFAIVGDFQQAIYAPRSDLRVYRTVHDEISAEPRGTSSRLKVTFRCDAAIIEFVNRVFPSVLNNLGGQSAFEQLSAREDAGRGQVVRWICPDEPDHAAGKKVAVDVRTQHEARFIARTIRDLGPSGLGASDWSQVAILCPRKNWLLEIQRELIALGLPVQLHSSNEQRRDRTARAWLTALVWIAAHPDDSFEIAGVLREIFGVSDDDIARYTDGDGDNLRLNGERDGFDNSAVGTVLQLLRGCLHDADSIPLFQAVHRLVETTRLRERLRLIGEAELENVDRDLDELLAVVASRSAEGATLIELAEVLRVSLTQLHPGEEEIRNAIQLLTSHKAKGLEWQVVIAPFIFRAIEFKSLAYPRVDTGNRGQELISRDKSDFERQVREMVDERERLQLQRLLYVMATRAKRTLVMVDDEALFAGSVRRSGWSPGELLGFLSGQNREIWKALPEKCEALAQLPPAAEVSARVEMEFPGLTAGDIQLAVQRAGSFQRRTTPHTLAVHRRDEAEPEVWKDTDGDAFSPTGSSGPGVLYGTWWHEFVQTIPWAESVDQWQQKYVEAQGRSPDPSRSAREWQLFRASKLAGWLAKPGLLVQVELPFLFLEGDHACLEGVMDLAVYTESDKTWQVIDWKTNRIGADGSRVLVDGYREQIRAYVRALRGMLSAEVKGSLYLTQTGEWVTID